MTDKQALREAADAANKSSWGRWESYHPHKGARGYEVKVGVRAIAQHCLKVDAAFIAAANPVTVLALLDELEALQSFRTAFNEWHDKTEWVQGNKRLDVIKPWGKHRADVLKLYIDHLESSLEAAEHTAAVDHEAACSLVEENEELKRRIAELREWNVGLAQESFERQQRIAELQIARDKCFLSGLKTGWQYGIADDTEGYNREIADAQAVIDRAAGIGKGE